MILGKIVRFVGTYSLVPSLSWLGRYKKFRIAIMSTDRLGHLSLNNHLFFIRKKIGALENTKYLLISPSIKSKKVANVSLLLMFIAYSKQVENVRIICSSFLYFFFTFFQAEFRNYQLLYKMTMESKESEFSLGIKTISFSEKQKKHGECVLNRMPIPKNKKIIDYAFSNKLSLNTRLSNSILPIGAEDYEHTSTYNSKKKGKYNSVLSFALHYNF